MTTSPDPRPLFATALATATTTIAGVRPDQLAGPTPCEDYDVRSLLGHLVSVVGRVTALAEGTDPMAVPTVTMGIADAGLADHFAAAGRRAEAAWADDSVLDRTMTLPWATAPGRGMLATYTSELTVHTWDLAVATGQQPSFDAAVVAASIAASRMALPPGDREAAFEAMRANLPAGIQRPFGNPVEVTNDAAPIDVLVGWYGRRPEALRASAG